MTLPYKRRIDDPEEYPSDSYRLPASTRSDPSATPSVLTHCISMGERTRVRGRGRSARYDSIAFGSSSNYGYQPRRPESAFQYDAATHALISDVHRVMDQGRSFTLAHFRAEAEGLLQRGLTPVLEYYLHGDFGECMDHLVGKYTKPWSPLSIAEILRNHSLSFPQIVDKAKGLGTTLAKLLMMPDSDPRHDAEMALKVICCIREALSMFPKERPHYMAHMPPLKFSEVMDICRASRKEMKKVWSNCIEFVKRPAAAAAPLPSQQFRPPLRSTKLPPSDVIQPSAPPLPPLKSPDVAPTSTFFLGLQTDPQASQV